MACRHIIQSVRSWSVRDLRCLRASLSLRFSPPHSVASRYFLSATRSLSHPPSFTPCREVSFNVQDTEDFTQRVVNSNLPVIVDFHAQWCGPCKILGPRLEKAVAKQQGRVTMAKVDIDEHTDLAIEYGVSAVPTVVAMRGGKVLDQFVGIKDEDQLDSFVNKLVGP